MKIAAMIYAALLSWLKSWFRSKDVVHSVPHVNLQRYMGRWYEIASYPQWFEKGLTDVWADYTAREGYVEVVNAGYKNGKRQEVHGRAVVVRDSGGAKLKVSFFRPFSGKYWIVALSEEYRWAVVSNPNRSMLWILCREPRMDRPSYDAIRARLQKMGFDLARLVPMRHVVHMA